MLAGGAFWN
jgi:pilus assembly protein Flp/PilA